MDLIRQTLLYPGLAALGLEPAAWAALASQGGLCAECGKRGSLYKLRFRINGWQRSRYVGKNSAFAEQLQRELALLQEATKFKRRVQRLVREARQCIRSTKRQIQPVLPTVGRRFHGYAIRRQGHGHAIANVVE